MTDVKDELDYSVVAMYALQHCVAQPKVDKTQVNTWIKANWDNFALVDKRLLLEYIRNLFYSTGLIQLGHTKESLLQFLDLWTWIQKDLIEADELFDLWNQKDLIEADELFDLDELKKGLEDK